MDNFNENGYIILKNVFNKSSFEKLGTLQEKIYEYSLLNLEDPFKKYSIRHRGDQGVLYDLYQRHPEFRFLAHHPEIISNLKQVLGENIIMYDNSLIFKPKGKENEVPWHYDFMSRPEEPQKVIAWIPLDDVNRENGTLKVIPGSHKHYGLEWYRG